MPRMKENIATSILLDDFNSFDCSCLHPSVSVMVKFGARFTPSCSSAPPPISSNLAVGLLAARLDYLLDLFSFLASSKGRSYSCAHVFAASRLKKARQ
jgi:hypothetical protein